MELKDMLKQRRLELGLTLDEVARIVNVSGATISRWESGNIENMRRDKIALLAKALQVSPSYIMGWDIQHDPERASETESLNSQDPLAILNRKAKKMSPEKQKQLLDMAKVMFKEDFGEDD